MTTYQPSRIMLFAWYDPPTMTCFSTVYFEYSSTILHMPYSFVPLLPLVRSPQMGLQLRRLGYSLHRRSAVSPAAVQRSSKAGIAVIVMACVAECCSWTNLITESNLFAVFEQALWGVLFLVTGIGFALLLPRWAKDGQQHGAPCSYILFVVLVIGMGLEQGYAERRRACTTTVCYSV